MNMIKSLLTKKPNRKLIISTNVMKILITHF